MAEQSPASSAAFRAGTPTIYAEFPILPMYHPEFYFEDGNLVILVDSTLFKVFRSTFTRHSPVFRELFTLPGPAGQITEGSGDENPLYLAGISSVDFERLLWVLYPPIYGAHRAKTADEWTSILNLATRWEFDDIRALAIRELQSLDIAPVDKIVLSREFDIGGRWAIAAYTALCERRSALSLAEARRLGLEIAVHIAQMRERLRSGGSSPVRGSQHSPARPAAYRRTSESIGSLRSEHLHWDNGKVFRDRTNASPRVSTASPTPKRPAWKVSPALSNNARMVAEAFGLTAV